jgi:hypothetical protein
MSYENSYYTRSDIGPDDLVINVEDQEICSGGFCIKSIMIKSNISPIRTMNSNNRDPESFEKVSDMFDDLAVPNWSYSSNVTERQCEYDDEDDEDIDEIDDDLYEKLLDLVKHVEKKKLTRRKREKLSKKFTKRLR